MTRPRRPSVNCTTPADLAKIVSSRPMPTPSPGLKRVPRWRTMISPPDTSSPANTLTPSRFALESRPLRLEPSPFLCAMSSLTLLDARHLEPRELLAVAGRALVAALGLELEDADLGAALVPHDPGLDRHLAERRAEQRLVAARVEQRLEVDGRALVGGQALDEEGRPLLDAVLLAAGADYCIRGFGHHSLASDETSAFARERRRPPLRPRRRGFDDTASSPTSVPPSASRNASELAADDSDPPSSVGGFAAPRDRRRPRGRAVSSSASATAAGPVPACTAASSSASVSTAASSSVSRRRGLRGARFAARSRSLRRSSLAAAASSATSASTARAEVRPACSIRTSTF